MPYIYSSRILKLVLIANYNCLSQQMKGFTRLSKIQQMKGFTRLSKIRVWNKYKKIMTNKLAITMKIFGHIVSFNCAKQLLEQMWALVTRLQSNFGLWRLRRSFTSPKKHVKRLMSYFSQYKPRLSVWLTNFVWKRNGHFHLNSR